MALACERNRLATRHRHASLAPFFSFPLPHPHAHVFHDTIGHHQHPQFLCELFLLDPEARFYSPSCIALSAVSLAVRARQKAKEGIRVTLVRCCPSTPVDAR